MIGISQINIVCTKIITHARAPVCVPEEDVVVVDVFLLLVSYMLPRASLAVLKDLKEKFRWQ